MNTETLVEIPVIDIETIPYNERDVEYILLSQDYSYDEIGNYHKSSWHGVNYCGKDTSKKRYEGTYLDYKQAKRRATTLVAEYGFDKIYYSKA